MEIIIFELFNMKPRPNVQDFGESVLILNILKHSLDDRFSLEVHALNLIFQKMNFGSHLLPLV